MSYTTRIAPSPTGNFHIGTARTAYMNYLAARNSNGTFILRIDDTDDNRNDDKYVQDIIDTMKWLGLDYDISFRQSHQTLKYQFFIQLLLNQGKAYKQDGAVILKNNYNIASWNDSVVGDVPVKGDIGDIVLMKSNGTPTYHFANVVDDYNYKVNYVIRGTDHINNTPRQLAIYYALGLDDAIPKYAHIGLIHKDGKKISKSDLGDGDYSSMQFYKDKGYSPDAILNALLFLGWGHPNPNFDKDYPLVNKDLAIQIFSQGKLRNVAANLNINKLDFLNKKYKVLNI